MAKSSMCILLHSFLRIHLLSRSPSSTAGQDLSLNSFHSCPCCVKSTHQNFYLTTSSSLPSQASLSHLTHRWTRTGKLPTHHASCTNCSFHLGSAPQATSCRAVT